MGVVIVTPPAVEPVSTAEAKLFLRVDHAEEDAAIAGFVRAARETVECWTGRALITRRVRETRDRWKARADGAVRLALAPVAAVHAIRVAGVDGALAVHDGARSVDLADGLLWTPTAPEPSRPVAGIEVEYDAGYAGVTDVPGPLRHAVLLLAAAHYEARAGAGPGVAAARLLAAPYDRVRL